MERKRRLLCLSSRPATRGPIQLETHVGVRNTGTEASGEGDGPPAACCQLETPDGSWTYGGRGGPRRRHLRRSRYRR